MLAPAFITQHLGVGTAWAELPQDRVPLLASALLPVVEVDLHDPHRLGGNGLPPRVLHCRQLPLANRNEAQLPHLGLLQQAVDQIQPAWVSAPLGFSRVAGLGAEGGAVHTGTLLPALQGTAAVLAAARRLEQLRRLSGRPVALRNLAHALRPWPGELHDGDYLAAVAEAAGCGIELDLAALRHNEQHGRATVDQVLQRLPAHRVWSLRLAPAQPGGPLASADLALLGHWLPQWPQLSAVVVAPQARLDPETTAQLQALWAGHARGRTEARHAAPPQRSSAFLAPLQAPGPRCSADEWERALAGLANGLDAKVACKPAVLGLAHEPGLAVWQAEVAQYRSLALQQGLPLSWRALVLTLGQPRAQALRTAFWRQHWPAATVLAEARHFAQFLREREAVDTPLGAQVHQLIEQELGAAEPGAGAPSCLPDAAAATPLTPPPHTAPEPLLAMAGWASGRAQRLQSPRQTW